MAYLDKHSTLDPVMVSVVSSIPTGGNFLKFLGVNFGLKCKCDLIVKTQMKAKILTIPRNHRSDARYLLILKLMFRLN